MSDPVNPSTPAVEPNLYTLEPLVAASPIQAVVSKKGLVCGFQKVNTIAFRELVTAQRDPITGEVSLFIGASEVPALKIPGK